uniref:Protein kinase domain-containing protein n=1 Tax=Macrostomum lignano TaxID=282301 RepID=A0A1I8JF16_9PLAT
MLCRRVHRSCPPLLFNVSLRVKASQNHYDFVKMVSQNLPFAVEAFLRHRVCVSFRNDSIFSELKAELDLIGVATGKAVLVACQSAVDKNGRDSRFGVGRTKGHSGLGSGLSTRIKEPLNLAQRLRIGLFYEYRTKKVFYLNCGAEAGCKMMEFEDADKLAVDLTIDGDVLGQVSFTDCSEHLPALISFPDATGNRCGDSSQPVLSWMHAAAQPAAEEEQTSPKPKRMRLVLVLLVVSAELAAMSADSGAMRLASFSSSEALQNFVTESQRTRVGSGLSTRIKEPLNLAQRLRIGLFYEHRTKKVFYLNCGAEAGCKMMEFEDADKLAVDLTIDGEVLGQVSFTYCTEQLPALISFPDATGNRCGDSSQPVLSWMLAAAQPAAEEEQRSPKPKRMRLVLVLLVVSGAILLVVTLTLIYMRRRHSLQYIAATPKNEGKVVEVRQSGSEKPLVCRICALDVAAECPNLDGAGHVSRVCALSSSLLADAGAPDSVGDVAFLRHLAQTRTLTMKSTLWQLLSLLLSMRVTASLDCSNVSCTVTVQLSRADVLRTWQPSGAHCRWCKSRQSETNRFPAAVRSGPRWLVMQLRQPMMLKAVSVRDWGGQWLAAAPVGSPVSAVGASSLPLELQLEDPCRASWEALNGSDRWRSLDGSSGTAMLPVAYLLFSSSQQLQWSALNLQEPCQTAVVLGSSPYWEVGQTRHIAVTSSKCSIWNVSHSCRLLQADGASPVPLHRVEQSSFSSVHQLQVSRSMAHQNWSVRCSVNQSGVVYDEAESLEQLRPPIFYPASIQVNGSIESSRLHLAVAASDARPPVSSVVCQIANSTTSLILARLEPARENCTDLTGKL